MRKFSVALGTLQLNLFKHEYMSMNEHFHRLYNAR